MSYSKYSAKKCMLDGFCFDSQKEMQRYTALKLEQRAGTITQLELQPRYDIVVNGQKIGFYKGDFQYLRDGVRVLEDVKSSYTAKLPVYRLKKKLIKAIYHIDITEVGA